MKKKRNLSSSIRIHHDDDEEKKDDPQQHDVDGPSLKEETVPSEKSNGSSSSTTASSASKQTTPSSSTQRKSRSSSSTMRRIGRFLRLLGLVLAHVAVLSLFTGYRTTQVLFRVHQLYLQPQLDAFHWIQSPSDRTEHETTYYHRVCDTPDVVTTHDTKDLVLNDSMSTDDRVQHMLRHGVSIYPNLLDPDLAARLRSYILQQNELERGFYVIENDFRYSFGIRVHQDETVSVALQQILSRTELVRALQGIVGPNPAVIEFTAITSQHGATTQRVHQDVVPEGSPAKYGRSFIPSYSLFVPLQNTTAQMGATQVCPGSHMCADCLDLCESEGFAVSGSADLWPTGYGALVNQQTAHRGMAHNGGPDRVLFILTFAPRPEWHKGAVETRQLAQGGSYSMHWMQWGHTLKDFRDPTQRMRQPWKLLRALGLWKPADVEWGWDFVSTASMRLRNEEAQYSRDDLDEFMEQGGIPHVPPSLHGDVPEDVEDGTAWVDMVLDTVRKCGDAMKRAHWISMAVYVLGLVLIQAVGWMRGSTTRQAVWKHATRNLFRLVVFHAMIVGVERLFLYRVSQTPWAQQIRNSQLYHVPHENTVHGVDLPGTLPLDQDILRLDDYQSNSLASYNRVLEVTHPGNAAWNSMVRQYSTGFMDFPSSLQDTLCAQLLDWARQEQRRILAKNREGEWAALPQQPAARFCRKSLLKAAHPVMDGVLYRIDSLLAETKFGVWRDLALHRRFIPLLLEHLHEEIVDASRHRPSSQLELTAFHSTKPEPVNRLLPASFRPTLPERTSRLASQRNRTSLPPRSTVEEPYLGAWLQVGDVVEAQYPFSDEWYKGVVQVASADRVQWEVLYDDGEAVSDICRQCIRPYVPYSIGEEVDWHDNEDVYWPGKIVEARLVGSKEEYGVRLEESERLVTGVLPVNLRRAVVYEEIEGGLDPGTRVIVMFQGLPDELYPGVIRRQNKDGSYEILYDDGDIEYDVPLDYIRLEK